MKTRKSPVLLSSLIFLLLNLSGAVYGEKFRLTRFLEVDLPAGFTILTLASELDTIKSDETKAVYYCYKELFFQGKRLPVTTRCILSRNSSYRELRDFLYPDQEWQVPDPSKDIGNLTKTRGTPTRRYSSTVIENGAARKVPVVTMATEGGSDVYADALMYYFPSFGGSLILEADVTFYNIQYNIVHDNQNPLTIEYVEKMMREKPTEYEIYRILSNAMKTITVVSNDAFLSERTLPFPYRPSVETLRLRVNARLDSETKRNLKPNDAFRILEEGPAATIDGIADRWIKVVLPTGEYGWCFGGYTTAARK